MCPRWVCGLLALIVVSGTVYGLTRDTSDEETARLEAEVERLEGEVSSLKETLVKVDSAAAVEIREAQEVRSTQDTIFRRQVDTIRAHLPPQMEPFLDSLVRADSIEDAAYEAEIAAQDRQLAARDSVIRAMEAQQAAQAALVARLQERLDPPLLDRVFGGIGEGVVRVGVVGLAVATERYEAAAGAGAMWAVDVAF